MPTDEEILSAFGSTSNSPSDDDILAAFGIPVKKKVLSAKSEPSTSDSKTPSPLLEKSGEKADRQQSTAGNVIPSFNPNDKGLSPSEKQLLKDRDLALKRRDKEIESRNADKFVQENIGIKARTGFLQKDANGEIAKSNDNTIPSLRDSNLLPSSKYVDFGTPPAPKKGSYDEFDLKNEEEKEKRLERADIALEEGQKDAELAKLSIADKAKSYANSFLQGGFGGLASTVNLAGTVYTKTKEAITGKKDWGSRADDEIARRTLNNFQQEYIPEANALKGSLGSQVARGFGQMGAMAATATVTGGSAIIPSVSAFAETYDSESQEALKNGASESTANKVALGNAFASMGLEAIPVLRMLNRANKTTGGATFKQIALELGKKGVKGGLEEGGTEMAQQGTSNLIAQKTYDKKRELGSGIVDAGGVGGIIGLTSTIALSALGVSLKNAKTPKEKAEIESQIAELEGLKNEAIIKEQKQIDSKKAEILASLEPDGNGGVIMTPEAKAELDKLENARVQIQEPTKQSATITEGEKPSAFASKQQEPNGKSASTEANKGATVESAVIEIGGETFEGKNHAEAILKAQQAGKDISKVDRQGEGMFKLSDGTVISREQAKETFGADKAEMLITQDEAANKANNDYEKVKTEFKRKDIATKIASNDTGGIANTPNEDVPLLVEERLNPKEDVLTDNPIKENITLTVPQPTIAGAQEKEGATGVQAVSENVQETGAANAENMPISEEREQNKITNEPTKEQNIQASVLNKSGTEDSPTKKGAEQVTRKPSQEKIAEKLSKGLSALGKLSEDKKRIKSDGVFVKEKRARNKAIRELDPTNATQAARQYLLERGRLDTKSIQDETGMSLKEMNQLIGIFGTSKSHPNLEKAAENILARHEYLKDKGIEPQDIRNALIDLLSSDRTKWNEDQYNELDPEQLRKKFEASQIPEGFEYEKIGIKEPNDEVAQQDFDFQYELSDEQQQELNNLFYDTETFDAENSSTKGKSGSKRTGTDQGEYVSGNGSNDSRTSAQGGLIQKRYGNNSKSSEEVVSEINSKSLTRVEGLNMGQSQARGTYVSTEAKNRYETADKKAKKAKVKIKTPFTFKSETGIHQFRNDILREQIEQPGSILEEIDFADYKLPDPWDNVTIDDLSDSGIVKLAGLVSDKLIEEGYDSIYWPETKTHEGELVVFDRNNVEIEGDLSPKDKLALGVEALANIYGITKNAKQSDINTKQALNLIAEALYDQLGVTGNALIKAIKDYLKENKIDNLNGEVDKFKTDIINGIEEYKNIVDVQEYIAEIKGKPQVKESKFNIRQRLGIAVNDALARLADKDRLMYKVLRNSVLLEEADTEIAKDIDAAFESVVAEDNKVSQLAGVFAKAGRLINIFEDAIKNTDDQQAKEFLIEKLDQIRVATQKKATLGGQAVQALSTVGNILPERDMVVLGVIAQREATINKEGLKTIESEATKDVDKAVLMAIDEIVSSDPKIKQLESKIAELEAKIAAGKTTKRKEAVKKAIDKLDSLINNNLAFSDATGTVAIAKQGLIIAREAIKAGNKVVDAIEKAVRFVNAKTGNKKWDEKAFRDAIENSLADVREDLDALYDEKKSLQESKKKLKDSIRAGLQSGDFSDLELQLTEKGMSEDDMDTYVSDLKDKHEKAVIYAVSKRIDKNLGLTVKRPVEKSLAYIEANSEPLTADEIEARLKNEIDKVSAKVEKLVAKRIEKNTATDEELAEKKKLAELKRLESQKSHEKADKLAMDIFKNEPLTEEEINARLSKKKKELDDKIESERAKRIKKNLETTKEKQLRTERENLERDIREKTTSQIAKKIANSEPLTADEKMSLLKKKNALEDLTDSEQRRLKELYDEVERVFTDPDLKIEAINNLRHEAQKLIPKTRLSSFLSYYNSNIYYPNILSGGWTSALNLKDAFFNTIDLVPQMRKGGVEAYKDQFKGLKEGLRKAKIGMAEGFVNQGLLNNAEFDKLDLGKKTSEDFAKEGSKIAKYYSKWVGRVMALPNTIGEATKFSALSFVIQKDLESQGFKGRALVDKKNELLYGTFGKREELIPKARKLVYGTENPTKTDVISEAKVQRTVTNMILSDMQEQMTTKEGQEAIEIATQIKDKATYQQTATGILGFLPYAERKLGTMGKSGKAIQEFTRKFLGVEFLNTSMNVANTALDYTPYGYARANDKSVSRGVDAAIKYLNKEGFFVDEIGYSEGKNSEEKARIKEKANKGMALLGGILLTTIARSLSDDDDEKNRFVTGSLKPIDYLNQKTKYQHEKEANLAMPAYSIKLPGIGWWNYSGTPLVGVLSIAGNVSDYLYAKKSQDLTWVEYGKAIPYGAVNTLKAILIDGTPIGSQIERNKISKNTDAENTESQLGQWMAHKTANMVGGLVPNLIKSLAKDFDSTNYTPDDMAMMVAKSTGVLNMYSAFGGNPNVPYAVDLLGNKISSKSGEKYFNIQKASVSEEDKKIYKLLLDVYKEPSNYPSYINPKMPVFANEIKEKEYKDKLDVIDKLHKKGSITKEGMENRIDALEKESAKIDDIGNDKVLYTKALETCGELFKRGLQDNYDAIKNMPNDADRRKEVDEILKEAKRLTKAQFAVQPDEEEPTKTE